MISIFKEVIEIVMKKIISSRSALVACVYACVVFFGFTITGLALAIAAQGKEKIIGILISIFLLSMLCILVVCLNRMACIIWVEDGIVKRKGLIRGFYKECRIDSIRTVKIHHSHREVGFGAFIYLVDDRAPEFAKFLRMRKDSYICFRKNKKNLEFLRTFWSGEVEK